MVGKGGAANRGVVGHGEPSYLRIIGLEHLKDCRGNLLDERHHVGDGVVGPPRRVAACTILLVTVEPAPVGLLQPLTIHDTALTRRRDDALQPDIEIVRRTYLLTQFVTAIHVELLRGEHKHGRRTLVGTTGNGHIQILLRMRIKEGGGYRQRPVLVFMTHVELQSVAVGDTLHITQDGGTSSYRALDAVGIAQGVERDAHRVGTDPVVIFCRYIECHDSSCFLLQR